MQRRLKQSKKVQKQIGKKKNKKQQHVFESILMQHNTTSILSSESTDHSTSLGIKSGIRCLVPKKPV